jgi:two pore calcium channel protein 1
VNNWYVIMEGYALTTKGGDWSRIFFMSFYVFSMVVVTIVVAFILEAFLFRIQYKRFLSKTEGRSFPGRLFTFRQYSCKENIAILCE